MNKKQFNRLLPLAYRVAQVGVNTMSVEDEQGHAIAYTFSIGDRRYESAESFYADYPQCHSPYKPRKSGEKWTLVFMIDEDEDVSRPVDGEPLFDYRQGAYRRAKVLNDWWQKRQSQVYA